MSGDWGLSDKMIEGGILLVAFLGLLGSFFLMLSKTKDAIVGKMQAIKDELDDDIKDARGEINTTRQWTDSELARVRHEVAESIAALRQRIADVDRGALEKYVWRDDFSQAMSRIEQSMSDAIKRLEDFVLRVERRIEGKGGQQ